MLHFDLCNGTFKVYVFLPSSHEWDRGGKHLERSYLPAPKSRWRSLTTLPHWIFRNIFSDRYKEAPAWHLQLPFLLWEIYTPLLLRVWLSQHFHVSGRRFLFLGRSGVALLEDEPVGRWGMSSIFTILDCHWFTQTRVVNACARIHFQIVLN